MGYTPPKCGEIVFSISLRTPLDPCNLVFDLLPSQENSVNIFDSVISIKSDNAVLFDNEPVVSKDSRIILSSGICTLFSANAVIPDSTVLKIISDTLKVGSKDALISRESSILVKMDTPAEVYVLPSVRVPDSRILVKSDESPIKVLPSVATTDSRILIKVDPPSEIKNPDASDLPTDVNTGGDGVKIPWKGTIPEKDSNMRIVWGVVKSIRTMTQIPWDIPVRTETSTIIPWKTYEFSRTMVQIPWGDFTYHADHYSNIPWKSFELPDPQEPDKKRTYSIHIQVPWATLGTTDHFTSIPWYYPDTKDQETKIPWQDFLHYDVMYKIPWYSPEAVNTQYILPWGPVDWSDICCQQYWPPKPCTSIMFEMHEPAIPGVCQNIVFSIGPSYNSHLGQFCPYQHHHSGRRDPFDPNIKSELDILKTKDEYDMNNVVSVQLFSSDMQPIEVTSISIRADKQSYLWSFSLTIGKDDFSKDFLEQLKPQWVQETRKWVYPELLIMVNYNYWVCTVESYQESRVFGKDSWQITGRSPSMMLGSPVCKKFNYKYTDPFSNDTPTSGAQIINTVLEGVTIGLSDTRWRLDTDRYTDSNPKRTISGFIPNSADDWGFFPNSISFQDSTQIDIVTAMASSIGAFIITEPCPYKDVQERDNSGKTRKLYLRPYYGFPPWHWHPNSPHWNAIWGSGGTLLLGVRMLHTDLSLDIGRSNELKSEYNAVMIMGTLNTGAGFPVVDMYRRGYEGEKIYAPDVTDEKLQTSKACIEIGRKVLSETGFWVKHTMKLYSLAAPSGTPGFKPDEPELPGLCWPGDFVQVQERQGRKGSRIWYGDVEAVQIDVVINNNAAYVAQTLGINEYADR